MHNKNNKVTKYRKPLNINIGVIIFTIMFVYLVVCIIMFCTRKHITGFEVRSGALSSSNTYEGIIIRDETIVKSDSSGYINYFAHEGEHIGVGNLVYTVDQNGKISDALSNANYDTTLSSNDLTEIKNSITQFMHNYSDHKFDTTYDFSYDVKGEILKLSNYNLLNTLKSQGVSTSAVNFSNASKSGVVVYGIDGFENLQPSTVSENTFKTQRSELTNYKDNNLVKRGDTAYKLITSETWNIVIPVPKERMLELENKSYVEVKFLKNQYTSYAKVDILNSDKNNTYVLLTFNNSMITFAKDRFIEIELLLSDDIGLKIPNSSIVEKEFYIVPKDYMIKGGENGIDGFLKESYDDSGNVTQVFEEISIYGESKTDYYIDMSQLRTGDYLCRRDSSDKYPISKTGTLVGVYNINKGYADFKEITVLYSNSEYSIVKSNTRYGLTEYDYIVLDSEAVNENDFIYE